jgi:DNA-directed RNA polymerase specialized sigma24 family protein
MTNQQFEEYYWPKYDAAIRAISRKLAQTNDSLAEDLYQEGLIALWECDPAKAKTNPDAFIRQAIKFRMIDYLRRERFKVTDSLDTYVDSGMQLIRESDGTVVLLNEVAVYRKRFAQGYGAAQHEDQDPELQ